MDTQHITSIVDATMIFASAAARLDAIALVAFELETGIDLSFATTKPRCMRAQVQGCMHNVH